MIRGTQDQTNQLIFVKHDAKIFFENVINNLFKDPHSPDIE